MKTTNGQAFEILMCISSTKETGRLGYSLAKQRRLIETELTEFIKIRNAAIMKNMPDGKWNEDGAAAANTEIAEYLDLPCEFSVCTVTEDVFIGGGLTSKEMYELYFMVEEACEQ